MNYLGSILPLSSACTSLNHLCRSLAGLRLEGNMQAEKQQGSSGQTLYLVLCTKLVKIVSCDLSEKIIMCYFTNQIISGQWDRNGFQVLQYYLALSLYIFSLVSPGTLRVQNLAPKWLSTAFSAWNVILQGPLTILKTARPPAVLRQHAHVS